MNLKSFSLGIGDILGVMIPGIIWVFTIFYLHVLYPDYFKDDILKLSAQLSQLFPGNTSIMNLMIIIISSYIIGYLSRMIPPVWLDWITVPIANLASDKRYSNYEKKKDGVITTRHKLRPYDFKFSNQVEKLKSILPGIEDYTSESASFHPIFICKRFILQKSPLLWAEAERREAEIRLVNGLFYPSLSYTLIFFCRGQVLIGLFFWIITFFLAFVFRRRRYGEVTFIYGATYLVAKDLQKISVDPRHHDIEQNQIRRVLRSGYLQCLLAIESDLGLVNILEQ